MPNNIHLFETIGFNEFGWNEIYSEHDITITWRSRTSVKPYGYGASEYGSLVSYGDGESINGVYIVHSLTNPGAETGDTTGWTVELGTIAFTPDIQPFSGTYVFYGATGINEYIMSQEVDLVSDGVSTTDIDAGILFFNFFAKQACYYYDSNYHQDKGQMIIRFNDASKSEISTSENELIATPQGHLWFTRSVIASIPVNTRYIDVVIRGVRTNNDLVQAYFDNMSCYTSDFNDEAPLNYFEVQLWKVGGMESEEGGRYIQYPISWPQALPDGAYDDRYLVEGITIDDLDNPDDYATYTLTIANNKS